MKTHPHLARSSFAALAALHTVYAQALSMQPPQAIPAPGTQLRSSVGATVNLMVVDAYSRQHLPIYVYRGEYWVAGAPGQRYELWLTSRLGDRRQLATTSVDGINVITGETAATLGRGYVLSPHATSTVTGWRKSEHEVAAFNFAAPQASYAAQTGRPGNVGVIGVAVFPELVPQVPVTYSPPTSLPADSSYYKNAPVPAQDSAAHKQAAPLPTPPSAAANGAGKSSEVASVAQPEPTAKTTSRSYGNANTYANAPVPQALGTQHGERVQSYAPTVAFKRASNTPNEVITLRYDSVDNLIARGVLQWSAHAVPVPHTVPTPFPNRGYVPDPPQQR